MGKLARIATSAAAIMLTVSPVATGTAMADPPKINNGIRVPVTGTMRNCDHTVRGGSNFGPVPTGAGEVVFRRNGGTVTADLQWVETGELGMRFSVGLIQTPRPLAGPCGPGSPGTAYTEMVIPDNGIANIHLESPVQQGANGVWLKIDRPGPHSQEPAEFYSSLFIAHF
ncbi:MAG TPA: hypothetical protein VF299_11940 [Mycobacterium sp.]